MFRCSRLVRLNRFNKRWINYSSIIRNDLKAINNPNNNITPPKTPSPTINLNDAQDKGNKDTKTNLQERDEKIKTGEITESLLNLSDGEVDKDDYLTTIFEQMEPYMDTYEVFKQLKNAGFTEKQSNEIINLLIVQLNSKLSKLSTKYSQLFELENERYLFESAQQELRVDITRSRESHINELINLINILERDFRGISDELNNDFLQLKNNNEVTINDQKQENTLSSKKIMLKIQETNHKITTELNSEMRSEIESLRWHLSRWGVISILICIFSGCATFFIFKKNADKRERKDEFIPLVVYEPLEIDEDDYHHDIDESDL